MDYKECQLLGARINKIVIGELSSTHETYLIIKVVTWKLNESIAPESA